VEEIGGLGMMLSYQLIPADTDLFDEMLLVGINRYIYAISP